MDAAINSCTKNPAEMLGFADRKGKLKVGYDVTLLLLVLDL